jgi:hypothetical protein
MALNYKTLEKRIKETVEKDVEKAFEKLTVDVERALAEFAHAGGISSSEEHSVCRINNGFGMRHVKFGKGGIAILRSIIEKKDGEPFVIPVWVYENRREEMRERILSQMNDLQRMLLSVEVPFNERSVIPPPIQLEGEEVEGEPTEAA